MQLLKRDLWVPGDLKDRLAKYDPKTDLGRIIKDCFQYLPRYLAAELLERICSVVVMESELHVVVFRAPGSPLRRGRSLVEDYGRVSRKLVTTVGVNAIVDAWQNIVELEIYNYHGVGTGSTAEAVGDTALVTELTTQLNPDNVRATGALSEFAANVIQSLGTNLVDGTVTIQEHGLFSSATVAAGVLFDRSLTGGQALSSGDSIQTTYRGTFTSGG